MKHLLSISVIFIAGLLMSCNTMNRENSNKDMVDMESKLVKNQPAENADTVNKTEEEWKAALSPEQYHVLREKGTERPYTGKFLHHQASGTYVCAACGNQLFKSNQKFDSHCGWPSFDDQLPGAIKTQRDSAHGMVRTEIMCAKCGSHLGHVFDDGPTNTGLRYCVNSLSLDFKGDSTGE